MPVALDRWGVLQLGLLLLAVPAQYLLTQYMASNESQRQFAMKSLINSAVDLKSRYLNWKSWHQWCLDMLSNIREESVEASDDMGESPAIEVLQYRDPEGHFAGSTEPRSPREPHVKYRIGQVIRHKRWGYRGIIVGWDPVARAPESWINQMHPSDKKHWRKLPNYSVLVDTRDRQAPQKTYVAEENIEVVTNVRVIHPRVEEYFEGFDGAQYLPRPWLKKLYPHDH